MITLKRRYKNSICVKNWRDKKIANGLCGKCGVNPLHKSNKKEHTKCKDCMLKEAKYTQSIRDSNRSNDAK